MPQATALMHNYILLICCLLVAGILFCMIRVVKGPRISDRVVATNVIGTLVMLIICLLSYVLDSAFLVDVALLYALLNMLIVVILCRLATVRHQEHLERARQRMEEEEEDDD